MIGTPFSVGPTPCTFGVDLCFVTNPSISVVFAGAQLSSGKFATEYFCTDFSPVAEVVTGDDLRSVEFSGSLGISSNAILCHM